MDAITVFEPVAQPGDITLLPTYCPIPGLGLLPMHSLLIRGPEPTLIDTGPGPSSGAFVERLSSLIDLSDLRWVWITHADPDHVGALGAILERAPAARVVSSFLGLGKLGLLGLVPPERGRLIEPGQRLDIGDRELVALRPPIYDAPETLAAFDARTRALFSADAFGALLESPVEHAGEVAPAALRRGLLRWAQIDAPWLGLLPQRTLAQALSEVVRLDPSVVYGAHLPPARGLARALSEVLIEASAAEPTCANQPRDELSM